MEYTIKELALLAGISTRTLRYYDEIGLLLPAYSNDSGYRIYGKKEVDALQQILFYKELGFELSEIKKIMMSSDFHRLTALKMQLNKLIAQQEKVNLLIANVEKTIKQEEGKIVMSDKEKFIGLKKELIEENEKQYSEEIRAKYGKDIIEESNAQLMNLTEEEYQSMQEAGEEIQRLLEEAVKERLAPDSETGKQIAMLHKKWLSYTWPTYTREAHKGLTDMYVKDKRFTAYYDQSHKGCAQFLRDAVWNVLG